jgi:dTDP-4-dehydrorhamnose 3,5-epimerase
MFDAREDSCTLNKYQDVILGEGKHYRRLIVPPGIWTGFKSLHEGSSLLMNVADIEHDPDEQINIDISEIEFNWNKGK